MGPLLALCHLLSPSRESEGRRGLATTLCLPAQTSAHTGSLRTSGPEANASRSSPVSHGAQFSQVSSLKVRSQGGQRTGRRRDRQARSLWDQPERVSIGRRGARRRSTEEEPEPQRARDKRPPAVAAEGADRGWPDWPGARGLREQ